MARKNELAVLVTADVKDYEIKMREAAERAKQFSSALRASDKSANTFSNNIRKVAGNVSILRGPLDAVTGRINAFATLMERTNITGALFAGTIAGTAAALTYATREAAAAELSMARVEGVLRATGYSAGLTGRQLEDMAQRLAFSTLASVEGMRAAQAQLLTFRKIGEEQFEAVLVAAQDLAESGFGTLESNAVSLGKALDNPTVGLASLRERGISLDPEIQKLIIRMVSLGESSRATALLLEEVNKQVGGTGTAVAEATAAGGLDTLGQSFQNLGLKIAETTRSLDAYKASIGLMTRVVQGLTEAVDQAPEAVSRKTEKALQAAKARLKVIEQGVQQGINTQQDYANWLGYVQRLESELNAVREKMTAEQVKRQEEETAAAAKGAAARAALDAQELAKTKANDAAIADQIRASLAQRIELSRTAMATAAGDPLAAENARYAAAMKQLAAAAKKDFARSETDSDLAIVEDYLVAKEQLEKEHHARVAAINQDAWEDRQKAMRERAANDFALQQDILAAEARKVGAQGELQRELDIRRQAAEELAIFEYQQAVQRGENEIELRRRLQAELLALEAEFVEKKNDIYRKAFAEQFKKQKEQEKQEIELRKQGVASFAQAAGNMASLLEGQRGAAFEASKAMAIAEAGISASLAALSILGDTSIPWWAKPPLLAAMASMTAAQMAKIYSAQPAARAAGGPVSAGSPYMVGEMGKELFVPSTHGTIVPNSKLGGSTTVNIVENPERGGQTQEAEDGTLTVFVAAVKQSIMRDIQRGTGVGSMVQRRGF